MHLESVGSPGAFQFLRGGGNVGQLMRDMDWAATPLGDPVNWPQSLRTSVSTCLNCTFPILVWWGPDLIKLYNDAYSVLLGAKHPAALGAKGKDVWPEIWEVIGPMLASAARGVATPANDLLLMLERNGYPEECYFSFSYSPIVDETGGVGGVFCPVMETTERVLQQRRLNLLRRLAAEPCKPNSAVEVMTAAAKCLAADGERDFPFCLLYSSSSSAADGYELVASARCSTGAENTANWDLRAVNDEDGPLLLAVPDHLACQTAVNATSAAALPLSGGNILVLGLSSHRPLPELTSVASQAAAQISTRLNTALIGQLERDRSAALAASEERLRRQLQQMPGFAAILDGPNHVFQYVNDAYVAISGREHFIGRSVRDVFPELVDQGFLGLLDEVFQSGNRYTASASPINLSGDDAQRFITFVYEPIKHAGGDTLGIFVGGYEVTEQLRMAEALRELNEQLEEKVIAEVAAREQVQKQLSHAQRMEALGNLAGGIAHDFNNVLQAMMGGLSLISRRFDQPAEVLKLARMALQAGERGAAITGRLLSFARKSELMPSAVDVEPLIASIAEILTSTIGAAITVEVLVESEIPPLRADRAQLETVLINLAVNARDAMPKGGKLRMAAATDRIAGERARSANLEEGNYIRIDVSDTGAGMNEETLRRASEPFFTTKPPGHGTGLGLAMARGFAEQSGGGFAILSELGQGTTVTIYLPQQSALGAQHNQLGARPAIKPVSGSHAMLVDDDAMVCDVLAQQLETLGYRVSVASGGLEALSKLSSEPRVNVLVTDYSMPGMNGLDLIEEARRHFPEVPAVLLTGFADDALQQRSEALAVTSTVMLRKPVSAEQLAAAIATACDPPST